jgi:hypothetical protein
MGRTDNAMAKRKIIKWELLIYKTVHRKLKIKQYESIQTQGWTQTRCYGRVGSSCYASGIVVLAPFQSRW